MHGQILELKRLFNNSKKFIGVRIQSLEEISPLFTGIGKVDVRSPWDSVLESESRIFSKALLYTREVLRTNS